MLKALLITLGDPGKLTGGYLYHRRMAALAPRFDARLGFASFPDWPFPLPALAAPSVLGRANRLRPDVLVLDSIAAGYAGPWLNLRPPRAPLAAMLHQPPGGIGHGSLRTATQAYLDRLAYRRTGLLLLASESLRDDLIAQGMPGARMRVVPPGRDVAGADAAVGPPRPETGEELRRGRAAAFLCVGNWLPNKGIHSLLEAFAGLPQDAATLHLAGDDKADPRYAAALRARLREPDLAGRVVVHGPLPVTILAGLYRRADVFVLPSVKETYGTVYGEAMTYGLPVVGWRAGNLPYLARHDQEGLLVPTGDIKGLSAALERLAYDPDLRHRLGESALRKAQTLPTWEDSTRLFFDALRSVSRL
ncbi:MAG: glycosyltransferase family 4 protein [Chloroflexia bacterium]